jgi:hypothetical protein
MHETFHKVGSHMSTLTAYETSPKVAHSISTEYQRKYLISCLQKQVSVKIVIRRLSQDLKVLRFVSINIAVAPGSHNPLVNLLRLQSSPQQSKPPFDRQ